MIGTANTIGVTKLLAQISQIWVLDDIRNAKTCITKDDEYSKNRIGKFVFPVLLEKNHCGIIAYNSDGNECYICQPTMVTTEIQDIKVSLNEISNTVDVMFETQNSIYIMHTDVDVSGMTIAIIDDIIQKIDMELEVQ